MEKRILGKTGLSVTAVGFGAGPIGYLDIEQAQVERTVNTLLDAGVNFMDTAAAYHGSEAAVGKALGRRRNKIVLESKCGQAFEDLPGQAWSKEVITATVDRSLQRLRTDYLDIMLLHSCGSEILQRGEAVDALVQARKAGKIRFLGYSGDNEDALLAASMPEVSVIEMSVNICDQANLETVLPLARERNIGIVAKRPLANGAWRSPDQLKGIYREYAQPYQDRLEAMHLNPRDLGFTSEADWPEIALRFTLSHPDVHVAIIGTTKPENAKRNLDAAAKGKLPPEALNRLHSAFKQGAAGHNWPGLT